LALPGRNSSVGHPFPFWFSGSERWRKRTTALSAFRSSHQKRFPRLVSEAIRRDMNPIESPGASRFSRQVEASLRRRAAAFSTVAPPARCNDVLPIVFSTLHFWDHMVDVLCALSTVLAAIVVTLKNGTAAQGNRSSIGNIDIPPKPHHQRYVEGRNGRVPLVAVGRDDVRAPAIHEHYCSPCSNNRQRLVARVQNERSRHNPRSVHTGSSKKRSSPDVDESAEARSTVMDPTRATYPNPVGCRSERLRPL